MIERRSNGGVKVNLKQAAVLLGMIIGAGSAGYKVYWFMFEVERNTERVKELKEDVRVLKQGLGDHERAVDRRFTKAHRTVQNPLRDLDREVTSMRRVMDRLALLEVLRGGETPQLLAGKSLPVRAREVRREMHGMLNDLGAAPEPVSSGRKQQFMESF